MSEVATPITSPKHIIALFSECSIDGSVAVNSGMHAVKTCMDTKSLVEDMIGRETVHVSVYTHSRTDPLFMVRRVQEWSTGFELRSITDGAKLDLDPTTAALVLPMLIWRRVVDKQDNECKSAAVAVGDEQVKIMLIHLQAACLTVLPTPSLPVVFNMELHRYRNIIVGRPTCPYYIRAKNDLCAHRAKLGIRGAMYVIHVLREESAHSLLESHIAQTAGRERFTSPLIFIDTKCIGGSDDLRHMLHLQ